MTVVPDDRLDSRFEVRVVEEMIMEACSFPVVSSKLFFERRNGLCKKAVVSKDRSPLFLSSKSSSDCAERIFDREEVGEFFGTRKERGSGVVV